MRSILWSNDSYLTSGHFVPAVTGEARIGTIGPSDFEVDVARTPSGPFGAGQTADFTWGNGTWETFSLIVNPATATAQFTVRSTVVSWTQLAPPRSDTLFLRQRAIPAGGVAGVRKLFITSAGIGSPLVVIPGPSTPGPVTVLASGPNGLSSLQVIGASLRTGFELRGELVICWNNPQPTGSTIVVQLMAGCLGTPPVEDHKPRRLKTYGPELWWLAETIAGRRPLDSNQYGDDEEAP